MARNDSDWRPDELFPDKGCKLSHGEKCVDCVFPLCVKEETLGLEAWERVQRNAGIAAAVAGGTPKELVALRFGVSERTVERILKQAQERRRHKV